MRQEFEAGEASGLAKQRAAYDDLPYPSYPYPLSAPEHLAALTFALGHMPAPPSRCRVLELGCGSGLNLIPAAMRQPSSAFVGVDLSPVQIGFAKEAAERLRLANISFQAEDLSSFVIEPGAFDYIICHGVYSWVPPQVQDAILRICRESLRSGGVAYVSYNTYPGWKSREVIRDAMRLRVATSAAAGRPASLARGMLDYLAATVAPNAGIRRTVDDELALFADTDEAYIAHELLSEHNAPAYVRDFAERADGHGLRHLCDADLRISSPEGYAPDVAGPALAEAGGDAVLTEQYLDFASNRQFRRSVLVKREHAPPPPARVQAARLQGLWFAWSPGPARPDTTPVEHLLASRHPAYLSFAAISEALSQISQPGPAIKMLETMLQALVHAGRIVIRLDEPPRPFQAPALPLSVVEPWRLFAALTRERGRAFLVNAMHEPILLDPVEAVLVPILDGCGSDEYLLAALLRALEEGGLRFVTNGAVVSDDDACRRMAEEHLAAFKQKTGRRLSEFAAPHVPCDK